MGRPVGALDDMFRSPMVQKTGGRMLPGPTSWSAGSLPAEPQGSLQKALEMAQKAFENRSNVENVQMVQQNVQVHYHASQNGPNPLADKEMQLQRAELQLQSQQNNLEVAVQQHSAALQQKANEVMRMEQMSQQCMANKVFHMENTLATEAKSFAQK